jgi:peptide/nickel transport system permease protein
MDFIDTKYASQISQNIITPEQVKALKAMYGLDDNSFFGIFKGYFSWLSNILRGELGFSFKYLQPVGKLIADNMWISFAMAAIATVLQMIIAIPLGITCATHQYSKRDYTLTVVTMVAISLPSFFLSALLVKVFAVDLGLFPVQGLVDNTVPKTNDFATLMDMLYHLVLPMLTVLILSIGGLMRYTRTNTLEVLNSDFIRTARAKGLSEKTVIYKHAFRNTLIPIVTLMAGILPGLFGGMMIVERVFAIPGIGYMSYDALINGDIPYIMGYNLFQAMLAILGIFLADIMYAVVDPRVKLV